MRGHRRRRAALRPSCASSGERAAGSPPICAWSAAEETGGAWTVRLADGSTVSAPILVDAAGAWADSVAQACGVERIGIEPKRRTMVQLRIGRSGLKDLPLVDDSDGRFYFKGEGDRTIWLSPHDEIATDPCDAAPEEIDIATAIDRFEGVVDWPVEAVERSWAGLRSFAPDRLPVYGYRFARARVLLVRGAGRVRDPDRASGGKAGGGACCWTRRAGCDGRAYRPGDFLAAPFRQSASDQSGFTAGGGCAGCRLRRRRARRRGRFRDGRCGP